MKKRKVLSLIMGLCLMLCMVIMPLNRAEATETNDQILEARKGVLQIAAMVNVDGTDIGYINIGTGFLVGGDNGAQTVITNYHVAHALTEDGARELLSLEEKSKVQLTLKVIVKRDVQITATIINESQKADFSILKLESPIYDRAPLTLADSSTVVTTQEVYALGFPGIVQDIQNDELYTTEDVTVTNGIVSKTSDVALIDSPIPCITHSARLAEGNSGGPLLNKDGYVIGVNTIISNDADGNNDYFFSTQINEVRDILDALGIEYKSADGTSSVAPVEESDEATSTEGSANIDATAEETEAQLSPMFDTLKVAIEEANKVDLTKVTDESADNFKTALNSAEAVYRNTTSTDADIQGAIDDLKTAQDGLVEASNSTMLIIIIAVAVVVVIIVVVVILLIVKKNSKKAKQAKQQPVPPVRTPVNNGGWNPAGGPNGARPINPAGPGSRPGGNPGYGNRPQPGFTPSFSTGSDGSAETSVLNDGGSETTVLSGGASLPTAYIIRTKNNEKVTITKQRFKIGKERRRVDYCISDNTNVSRAHADIIYQNGAFYVVDNNATNGTEVNGSSIAPGREYKLNNGDTIKFADEEFKFYM